MPMLLQACERGCCDWWRGLVWGWGQSLSDFSAQSKLVAHSAEDLDPDATLADSESMQWFYWHVRVGIRPVQNTCRCNSIGGQLIP